MFQFKIPRPVTALNYINVASRFSDFILFNGPEKNIT